LLLLNAKYKYNSHTR